MSEVYWKFHPVYNNYEGSSEGEIRTIKTNKIKAFQVTPDGYLKAQIWQENKRKNYRVHRFIFECFFCILPWDLDIDHLDGDRQNNRPDNLEAVTHNENLARARRKARYKKVSELRYA